MIRRVGLWVVSALIVASCGAPAVTITEDMPWFDEDGTQLPPDVVSVGPGPARCGWQSAAFLRLEWPPGGTDGAGEVRLYVRDPDEVLPTERLEAPYGSFAALPKGARYTGLRTEAFQLWVADDSDIYVYVVYGPRVEAWPRTDPDLDC